MKIKKEAIITFINDINNIEIDIKNEGAPNYLCYPIVKPYDFTIMLMPFVDPKFYINKGSGVEYPDNYKPINRIEDVDMPKHKLDFILSYYFAFYQPFKLTLNKRYSNHPETPIRINKDYLQHVSDLKSNILLEINYNINLRLGKWDILDYLSEVLYQLRKTKETFEMASHEKGDFHEEFLIRKIEPLISMDELRGYNSIVLKRALSTYWEIQLDAIKEIEEYISVRLTVIEPSEDYVKPSLQNESAGQLFAWTRSDTDLLELIVALHESGAIQNSTRDLTQKDAIRVLSNVFGKEEIKDIYKKLNSARMRKKDENGNFLTKLTKELDSYYRKQDERNLN